MPFTLGRNLMVACAVVLLVGSCSVFGAAGAAINTRRAMLREVAPGVSAEITTQGSVLLSSDASGAESVLALPTSEARQAEVAALFGVKDAEESRAGVKDISCQCEAFNASWAAPAAREPTLVYFDLGANKGDTFPPESWLAKGLSKMMKTTEFDWKCESDHALLFEANEAFVDVLKKKTEMCPAGVQLFSPMAVANCDGRAKLYASQSFDKKNPNMNDVGSTTRRDKTYDVNYEKSDSIAAVNLMRVLHESTLAEDQVVIKMDIEGGEFDIIPCLAESPLASRIDYLLLERHDRMMSLDKDALKDFNAALDKLRAKGVNVNDTWK